MEEVKSNQFIDAWSESSVSSPELFIQDYNLQSYDLGQTNSAISVVATNTKLLNKIQ